MNILINKYNVEKIKKIFKNKKLLFVYSLNSNASKCLKNSFFKISFVKNLIQISIFKQLINFVTSSILFGFIDINKQLYAKFRFNKADLLFIVFKNKIYSVNQFIIVKVFKFIKKLFNIKRSYNFYFIFKIILKFFKRTY